MRPSSCLALLSLLFVPACASDSPATENNVDSVSSDAGANPTPGGGSSGNGSGGGSGGSNGGSTGAADAGRADAGGNVSGNDAGTPPVVDKGDDDTTPGHDIDGIVSCGPKSPACDLKSQACCVTGFGADATNCQDGTTCKAGNPTPCDGPEECGAGEACCVSPVQGTTTCKKGTCGLGEVTLCHADNDCAAGKSCGQSRVLPWWGTCN
jgi:hypothetical protein